MPQLVKVEDLRERAPEQIEADSARAAAVANLRELAARLESGELFGARFSWREGLHHMTTVECAEAHGDKPASVTLRQIEVMSPERPADYDGARVVRESVEAF